jgi:hypothetical protein
MTVVTNNDTNAFTCFCMIDSSSTRTGGTVACYDQMSIVVPRHRSFMVCNDALGNSVLFSQR